MRPGCEARSLATQRNWSRCMHVGTIKVTPDRLLYRHIYRPTYIDIATLLHTCGLGMYVGYVGSMPTRRTHMLCTKPGLVWEFSRALGPADPSPHKCKCPEPTWPQSHAIRYQVNSHQLTPLSYARMCSHTFTMPTKIASSLLAFPFFSFLDTAVKPPVKLPPWGVSRYSVHLRTSLDTG